MHILIKKTGVLRHSDVTICVILLFFVYVSSVNNSIAFDYSFHFVLSHVRNKVFCSLNYLTCYFCTQRSRFLTSLDFALTFENV